MAGFLGQLHPFKEGENWQEYVEIFEHVFIPNDIGDDERKKVQYVFKCWVIDVSYHQKYVSSRQARRKYFQSS